MITRLVGSAPLEEGTQVEITLGLSEPWNQVVEAIGGNPILVESSKLANLENNSFNNANLGRERLDRLFKPRLEVAREREKLPLDVIFIDEKPSPSKRSNMSIVLFGKVVHVFVYLFGFIHHHVKTPLSSYFGNVLTIGHTFSIS